MAVAKKAKPREASTIAAAEADYATANKASRDAANKAVQIDDAVYDLKAVNPNRKAEMDTRTPGDLMDLIALNGREVADALAALRAIQ